MTWIRRVLGLIAVAAATWWSLEWIRDRRRRARGAYPNEWGVRTRPLSRRETAAALALEREIGRDMARAPVVPSALPGGRSTAAAGASP